MDEIQELLEDFLVEAFEMIEEMDQDLIELENNPDDLELLNKIFRVAHTIKGSSGFLNFEKLAHLTHHMEAVLDKARKGELKITPEIMDVILESVDLMKAILEYIRDNGNDSSPDVNIDEVVKKLDAIANGEVLNNENNNEENESNKEKKGNIVGRINLDEITLENADELDLDSLTPEELDAVLEHLVELRNEGENKEESSEEKKEENKEESKEQNEEKQVPAKSQETTPAKTKETKPAAAKKTEIRKISAAEQTIRVDVKRLDQLMNLIGELVLAKNRLIKIYNDVEERYEGEDSMNIIYKT
jgi:two-component system chemotaxis sensor kinase CheA